MDIVALLLIIVNAVLVGAVYAEFRGVFAEGEKELVPALRARPTRTRRLPNRP